MNTMIQNIGWDTFEENEGASIVALTDEDSEQVSGGWIPLAIAVIRVAVHPATRAAIRGTVAAGAAYVGWKASGQ